MTDKQSELTLEDIDRYEAELTGNWDHELTPPQIKALCAAARASVEHQANLKRGGYCWAIPQPEPHKPERESITCINCGQSFDYFVTAPSPSVSPAGVEDQQVEIPHPNDANPVISDEISEKTGDKHWLIQSAEEARAIARGEMEPAAVHYVSPAGEAEPLPKTFEEAQERLRRRGCTSNQAGEAEREERQTAAGDGEDRCR